MYSSTKIRAPIIACVSEFGGGGGKCYRFIFFKHFSRDYRERNRIVDNGRPRNCCVLNCDRRRIIECDRDIIVKRIVRLYTRQEIKNVNACLTHTVRLISTLYTPPPPHRLFRRARQRLIEILLANAIR